MRGGIYGCMAGRKIDREFTLELAAHLELLRRNMCGGE
jgi:hypothetical protein